MRGTNKKKKTHTQCWSENWKGRNHVADYDVGGRIILNWTLNEIGQKMSPGYGIRSSGM